LENFADIVIVGSGASGAAAAWSLSESLPKKNIICLDQGFDVDRSNYPTVSSDWELDRFGKFSPFPNVRNNFADYPIDDSNSPISIAQYNAVGGSTILYSAHFPRFHASDFKVNELDSVADDWPLKYTELGPFFKKNEQMMSVSGLIGDPAYPSYTNLLPPVPLGKVGSAIAKAFNEFGWHWWPSYCAINTKKYNPFDLHPRSPCRNLGPCNTGCPQSAKSSVDISYLPIAKKNGVRVLSGCSVQEVLLDSSGRAEGVVYFDTNRDRHKIKADIVIVACSGIGTPRLLLNSKSKSYPNGLLNNNNIVGKYLTLHPLAYVEGVFKENLQSSIGPHGCCLYSHEFYETRKEHDFVRGYTLHFLRGATPIESAISGHYMRRIPIGKDHHAKFIKHFNHTAGIAVIAEDLPEKHNRIELDYNNKDSYGMPGVKIYYSLGKNTEKILEHGINTSKKLFKKANAEIVSSFYPIKNTGWHTMGTARMGKNPKTSVVNKYGQSHDVKNLFIVDSSVFVTAGAVNPVATAQAITLFCCDYIKNNYKTIVSK